MFALKRSAGASPEASLRNPLHASDKAHNLGIHNGFETHGRHQEESKTRVPAVSQKDVCPPKLKKRSFHMETETHDKVVKNKRKHEYSLEQT